MATTKTNTGMDTNELLLQLIGKMNDNNEKLNEQQFAVLKSQKTVKIFNLAPYTTGFGTSLRPEGYVFEGNTINTQLTFAEVEEQVNHGNIALCGNDGKGNHAMLKILDRDIHKMLFPDNENPYYFTHDEMKRLLSIKDPEEFKKEFDRVAIYRWEVRTLNWYVHEKYGEENIYGWMKNIIDEKMASLA